MIADIKTFISQLDLECVEKRMVEKCGWTKKQASEGALQYKRFLWLKYSYGDKYMLPPSLDIDEFWHSHILHTKKYRDECKVIFGKYLHHHPHHDESGMINQTEIERMFEKHTQRLYYQEFGEYIYVVNSNLYKSTLRKFCEKNFKYLIR